MNQYYNSYENNVKSYSKPYGHVGKRNLNANAVTGPIIQSYLSEQNSKADLTAEASRST